MLICSLSGAAAKHKFKCFWMQKNSKYASIKYGKAAFCKALAGRLNAWQTVQIGSLFEHLPHPNILYFRFLAVDSFCFLA